MKRVDIRNYGKTLVQSESHYSGEIWIAEIKSRFVDQTFQSFAQRLASMGLKLLDMNKEEKMFVIMRFEKVEVMDGYRS